MFLLFFVVAVLCLSGAHSCHTVVDFQRFIARFAGVKNITEVPLSLVEGSAGSGEWLSGIVRRGQPKPSDDVKLQQKHNYEDALRAKNPDTDLKFPELVKKYRYPIEEHDVTTDDGYILKLFRLPYGQKNASINGIKKPVVFLMHGLIDSADGWVIMGPDKGLAYILADAGYDVWLGNARGNTYSRRHTSLTPEDDKFWQFSWEEIGLRDLPAMIDFALNTTASKKLHYIGHSQGTTAFFVMCSMRPEYNAKIRIMFALAPIAWMSHATSPVIKLLSPITRGIDWVSKTLGIGEFLPSSQLLSIAGGVLCNDMAFTQDICTNSLFIVCGFDQSQLNATMLPVIMGHAPAGSSVRQFLHYGQEVISKRFCRYDHGVEHNRKLYGTPTPPEYNVTNVKCPLYLVYSENDWLSHPVDVEILAKKLGDGGNVIQKYRVPHAKFNHLDYLWAIDVVKLVYERILKVIKEY